LYPQVWRDRHSCLHPYRPLENTISLTLGSRKRGAALIDDQGYHGLS
jgi:hypothetical protein